MNIAEYMQQLGANARQASRLMASASTDKKNRALLAMADAIDANREHLASANAIDLEKGAANGLDAAMLDRLALTPARIDGMIEGLRQVAALPDPVGDVSDMRYMPSGIQLGKMRVPLGVIGIIYESRPNVTVEAASLCLKSGNAAILRGGSEAIESNQAIAACVTAGLKAVGLPSAAVQVVETTDRAAVGALITMPEFVDVIVPRGGKGGDREQNQHLFLRGRHPYRPCQWCKPDGRSDRQHHNHHHRACFSAKVFCRQIRTGHEHGSCQHGDVPITDLSEPWAQDNHRPNERPKNRHQSPHGKRFTQEKRRTQSHIDGREVIHGRHIRDWNARHGIKP